VYNDALPCDIVFSKVSEVTGEEHTFSFFLASLLVRSGVQHCCWNQ